MKGLLVIKGKVRFVLYVHLSNIRELVKQE